MNITTEYGTPRTDAIATDGWSADAECVSADFARELERDLAAARAEVEKLKTEYAELQASRDRTMQLNREQAAELAALREVIACCEKSCRWSYNNSLGSQGIMWELAKEAIAAIDAARAKGAT